MRRVRQATTLRPQCDEVECHSRKEQSDRKVDQHHVLCVLRQDRGLKIERIYHGLVGRGTDFPGAAAPDFGFIFQDRALGNMRVEGAAQSALSFKVRSWSHNGLRYFVIGDASPEDLDKLSEMIKSAG